jgi:hypothetical protein
MMEAIFHKLLNFQESAMKNSHQHRALENSQPAEPQNERQSFSAAVNTRNCFA